MEEEEKYGGIKMKKYEVTFEAKRYIVEAEDEQKAAEEADDLYSREPGDLDTIEEVEE